MKTTIRRFAALRLAAVAMLAILTPPIPTAFAQGSLTPPGAPAPTMKSLDQIEARTIVNAATTPGDATNLFIISQPGSYYLTANVVPFHFLGGIAKNGIGIMANNVTLDLNGFALQGSLGNIGIYIPNAQTNLTVRNGTISDWNSYGVYSESPAAQNLVFERLNVSACDTGFVLRGTGVVRYCNCVNNVNQGIVFVFNGNVTGSTADSNGTGISLNHGLVSDCSAQNNDADGISIYNGTVSGCLVRNNAQSGIYAGSSCTIVGNTCIGNNSGNSSSDAGICIGNNNANTLVEDNHVSASGHAGICVFGGISGTNNVIIKNSVCGNGANNYIVPAGNDLGPVGTAATATSPWANISH